MCAKKTPSTTSSVSSPTKQQNQTTKTSVMTKKVPKQTTKSELKTSAISKSSTSPKKSVSVIGGKLSAVNETMKVSATSKSMNIKATTIATTQKKGISRDNNSTDNVKNKKHQQTNGKTNQRNKSNDTDKLSENKSNSNHIKANKHSVDEIKSNSSVNVNEECKKIEKSSSIKLNSGIDKIEKIGIKKSNNSTLNSTQKKSTTTASSAVNKTNVKKTNKKFIDNGKKEKETKSMTKTTKKNADKMTKKSPKNPNKKSNSKIKLSNELKNLAIEMSTSNTSLDEVIQQDGILFGIKTSICEMVKTKGRSCSTQNVQQQQNSSSSTTATSVTSLTLSTKKPSAEPKSHSNHKVNNKESHEAKVVVEQTTKSSSTSSSEKATEKVPKCEEKKIVQEPKNTLESVKPVVGLKNGSKISALVKAKHARLMESLSTKKVEKENSSNETTPKKKLKSDDTQNEKVTATTTTTKLKDKEILKSSPKKKLTSSQPKSIKSKLNDETKAPESSKDVKVEVVESISHKSTQDKSHKKVEKQQQIPKKTTSSSPTKSPSKASSTQQSNSKKKISMTKVEVKKEMKEENDHDDDDESSEDSEEATIDSESDSDDSAKTFKKPAMPPMKRNLRQKKDKELTSKRARVASLNAIAKVHYLYENEAAAIAKAIKQSLAEQNPTSVVESPSHTTTKSDDEDDEKNADFISQRSLRTAPGLRGIGKHWEMDSMSSDIDSDSDSNLTSKNEKVKTKSMKSLKATKVGDSNNKQQQSIDMTSHQQHQASKGKVKSSVKKSSPKRKLSSDESTREMSEVECIDKKSQIKQKSKKSTVALSSTTSSVNKNNKITTTTSSQKRKKSKRDDNVKNHDKNVVTKKRMASLNASAILAASYEIENYAARHESSSSSATASSSENSDDDDDVDEEKNENRKHHQPPTLKKEKKDVKMESEESRPKSTNLVKIDTDVTITGVYSSSSQETICKTLKYRTAYSVSTEECVVSRPPQDPPKSYTPLSALTNMRPPGGQIPADPCMTSPTDQYHPAMFDPHIMGPIPQYPYPHPSTPHPQAFPHQPMPSTSSAFYPPQQVHRDPMGYYQPAGPLISSHLLPPQSIPQPLESDQTQSSQSTSSTAADNVDPDVMITGGDITPRPSPYRYGPHHPHPDYPRPHPHQMHQYSHYPSYAYFGAPSPSPQPPPHFQEVIPYYPKYFPNPSYSRRYYYPLDYRSSQPVPPNPPSQILPSTPAPQHLEHYPSPPFYSAYGPPPPNTGGQCFSQTQPRSLQPQFLESPHYNSSSYHSCPKNAHTGTGPTNNKGPVSAEISIPKTAPASAIVTSSSSNNICKIENILAPNVMIKPENKNDGTTNIAKSIELFSPHSHSTKIGLLEQPEMTLSPARGSTGLQIPATVQQESAAQLPDLRMHQQTTFMTSIDNTSAPLDISQLKQEFRVKKELNIDIDMSNSYHSNLNPIENVKVERLERQQSCSVASASSTQVIASENNSTHESGDDECIDYTMRKNESDDVIELSDNSCIDPPLANSLSRRKLLSTSVNVPKKSPPNSYKSLIKQSTNSSLSKSKKANLKRRNILKPKSTTVLKKKIRMAVNTKKRFLMKKKRKTLTKKIESDEKSSNEASSNEKSDATIEESSSSSSVSEKNVEFSEDKSVDDTSDYSGKSNIDETIDRVAKGYFSESEILSTLSKYRKKKVKKQLKQKITKQKEKVKPKMKGKANKNQESEKVSDEKKKSKVDSSSTIVDDEVTKSVNKSKKPKKDDKKLTSTNDIEKPNKKQKQPKNTEKKSKKLKIVIEESIPTPPPTIVESDEDDAKITSIERDEETSTTVISSSLNTSKSILDETDVANNNNECFENNNQMNEATSETDTTKSVVVSMKQEPLTLYKTPGYGWTTLHKTNGKRGKKGAKFTNRKKQKVTLSNDIIIPRCTSIPRWSNGWTWVGEPFQAYVFLDSDNPPVPRTCYEAMRHEECGDVIRPHDCVLLRAGGKKNELPYVAKVAQLWENPEDGEMMMSLFWYYRPEHTEQGRQSSDAADEVFASRHKDHNSVACIEDKCYVLTYNEYCRYRRNLKMLEENLDEQPSSLVPRLGYHERRIVPPNTSPELVMFCRRVYDFRAKRLVEDKNKRK